MAHVFQLNKLSHCKICWTQTTSGCCSLKIFQQTPRYKDMLLFETRNHSEYQVEKRGGHKDAKVPLIVIYGTWYFWNSVCPQLWPHIFLISRTAGRSFTIWTRKEWGLAFAKCSRTAKGFSNAALSHTNSLWSQIFVYYDLIFCKWGQSLVKGEWPGQNHSESWVSGHRVPIFNLPLLGWCSELFKIETSFLLQKSYA